MFQFSNNDIKIPKLIVFDYGNTLVSESEFDNEKGYTALFDLKMIESNSCTPNLLSKYEKTINKELECIRNKNIEISFQYVLNYILKSFNIKKNCELSDLEFEFWKNSVDVIITPEIDKLLEYLNKIGIRTAVCSNISFSSKNLRRMIDCILPNNNFEFFLSSSEFIFRKPNSRIFELILNKSNLSPELIWFCGDNYETDIIGSKNAGIIPVWYNSLNYSTEYENILLIDDWNDLSNIIDYLLTKKKV